jgi:hypothetical protein
MNHSKRNSIVNGLLSTILFTFILFTSCISDASNQTSYNSLEDYANTGALRGSGYLDDINNDNNNAPTPGSGASPPLSIDYITGPASRASNTSSNYDSNYANVSNTAANANTVNHKNGFVVEPPLIRIGSYKVAGLTVPRYKLNPKCLKTEWEAYIPSNRALATQYFSPQIEVYNSTVIACFGYRGTVVLNGYGGCKFIGLIRVCARITPPCQYGNNHCCPQYQYPTNLDGSPDLSQTPTISGYHSCNNQKCPDNGPLPDSNDSNCKCCKDIQMFRICAFEDPWDLTDTKNSMPFHEATTLPSNMVGGSTLMAFGAMLMLLGLFIPGVGAALMTIGFLMILAGGIMNLVAFIGSIINQFVVDNRGCIDYPMGPSPPPYCDSIVGSRPSAQLMNICSQSAYFYPYTDNNIQPSETNSPCEIVKDIDTGIKKYSSFENPIVRIYFNNPLPVCASGNTSTSDVCVFPISLVSPSELWQSGSIINICADASEINCVRLPSGILDVGPFRPYYTLENAGSIGLNLVPGSSTGNMPFADFENISTSSTAPPPYLSFAGVQNSDYVDVTPGNLITIHDYNLTKRMFLIRFNDAGDQISITERANGANDNTPLPSDQPVGLIDRPHMPLPVISSCPNNNSCEYTSSQDPTTQMRIKASLGNPAKQTIIAVDLIDADGNAQSPTPFCYKDDNTSHGNATNNEIPCTLYASKVFSAYITDDNNRTTDTAGSDGSIAGNYNGAQYIGGLEYVRNMYCRGATKICLSGYPSQNKRVVAKLITGTTTDASGNTVPQSVVSNNIDDRVIPPSTPGTITSFYNPDINSWLSTSSNTRIGIGSYDPASGNYYENSYCNSGNNSCVDPGTGNYPATPVCTCAASATQPLCMQGCEWAFLDNGSPAIGTYNSTSESYIANPSCSNTLNKTCSANLTTYPSPTTCICSNPESVPPTSNICISASDSTSSDTKYTCTDNSTSPSSTTTCTNASCNLSSSCSVNGCDQAFQITTTGTSNIINRGYTDGTNYYTNDVSAPTAYGDRDANPIELGLCANIVQPSCSALNFTSMSDAINDGYANWNITTVHDQATGTCLTGAKIGPNGPPTRTCMYHDNNDPDPTKNFEQISILNEDTTTTVINGCAITSLILGPVTNPCKVVVPNWWPSTFLALNYGLQGAIFNQFNVNYEYHNNGKFVPTHSNSYQKYTAATSGRRGNGTPQKGSIPEQWVTTSWNKERSYGTSYTLNNTPRTTADGDEEMLFLTSDQWGELWKNNDLGWLTADNDSYNGCYVYDVSNNISATLTNMTVGMKLCKSQDKVSFSLVDTTEDPRTSYLNNAYIMQSNILDYYATNGTDKMTLTNNTTHATQTVSVASHVRVQGGSNSAQSSMGPKGNYLNHGIVVRRAGFPSDDYIISPPPADFVPIATPEGITIYHKFYSEVYAYNQKGSDGKVHKYTNRNTAEQNIVNGCALSPYRGAITYPYTPTNPASSNLSLNPYIPLYIGSISDSVNMSLVYTPVPASKGTSLRAASLAANISNYVPGNSAANESMFLWNDPNTYSACNVDNPSINQSKTCANSEASYNANSNYVSCTNWK